MHGTGKKKRLLVALPVISLFIANTRAIRHLFLSLSLLIFNCVHPDVLLTVCGRGGAPN